MTRQKAEEKEECMLFFYFLFLLILLLFLWTARVPQMCINLVAL